MILNKQIKNHTFQYGQTGIVKWWRWTEPILSLTSWQISTYSMVSKSF